MFWTGELIARSAPIRRRAVPPPWETPHVGRGIAAYLGLAIGDALGATVEFLTPSEIRQQHGVHKDITGGGWLRLKAGTVTDDTTMSLALGASILEQGAVDAGHAAAAFDAWMRAKPVDIRCTDGRAVMRIAGYTCETAAATAGEFARMLGVHTADLAEHAYRVNSGSEQLLMQVMSLDALQSATVDAEGLRTLCRDCPRDVLYLWYEEGDTVHSRLFFTSGQTVLEDSGTGSACANLGAYYAHCGRAPLTRTIFQGDGMGRPNRLSLAVDDQGIEVGGNVIEVGRGMFYSGLN